MGTDYLQLLDRRTAEVILDATESDLAALVDLRSKTSESPVWKSYWDDKQGEFVDFNFATKAADRLRIILATRSSLKEVKEQLLDAFCIGESWLYLDYWGCWAEVFSGEVPAGAISWEDFTKPLFSNDTETKQDRGYPGCYLLAPQNVESIRSSLETHRGEWRIMNDSDLDHLRGWQSFCKDNAGYCVSYQIDS